MVGSAWPQGPESCVLNDAVLVAICARNFVAGFCGRASGMSDSLPARLIDAGSTWAYGYDIVRHHSPRFSALTALIHSLGYMSICPGMYSFT